jgi:hypothetical protein
MQYAGRRAVALSGLRVVLMHFQKNGLLPEMEVVILQTACFEVRARDIWRREI